MRVLFFNEGNLGSQVMGQGQLELAIRKGLGAEPGIDARFGGLSPIGTLEHAAAVRTFGPLARTGLEFRALRWHLIQAARARRELALELEVWPADVVHMHSHSIGFLTGGSPQGSSLVLSVDATAHDWWAMPSSSLLAGDRELALSPSRALERRALARADLVVAWTAWARRGVQRSSPAANVVEIHPGLDLDLYRPAPRVERPRPRLLFVGGRFLEKGGEDLLAAVGERIGRDLELDVVTPAEVPARDGLRVHRLGPADPRLLELFQQADLLCLPTYGDAAPWVLVEAMACGTPVLSTEVGGIPDLLDFGRAGLIVAPGDRRALGRAVDAVLGDGALQHKLAAAGRARCEDHYDAERQTSRLFALMREL